MAIHVKRRTPLISTFLFAPSKSLGLGCALFQFSGRAARAALSVLDKTKDRLERMRDEGGEGESERNRGSGLLIDDINANGTATLDDAGQRPVPEFQTD